MYEPDALVRCAAPLPDDVVKGHGPLDGGEVVSPPSQARDAGARIEDYFRIPSLRHYFNLKAEDRAVIPRRATTRIPHRL
jgi:hypothetical protein